ncbi:phosphate acyltransferase PlsX [Planctomicrobium piriforme]|uniref:Phosphate acyltransferase n=1 Tax=Planctomicrobium piriforme TaxID=1576369 RepID=A0A1I3HKB8_9PLAN|nr:phosphate acyltransferase PlsX [Planctomicrobium piriforme]SFI35960.1 glycerol-3-phosphate acyltransferase PlsX [Planctomicrobium piriforme]
MRIALDAMGGDFAPAVNIDGAIEALQMLPEIEIALVGDRTVLDPMLARSGYSGERLVIVHAEGHVGMDEKPTDALRKKPDCSIARCWKMMAGKEVDALVSAGNTGGVVAAGLWTKLFLKDVKRPGIAVILPASHGKTVLMDVGANPGARPEHLAQYAIMGNVFAREVLGIASPRVGLMNIGSEDGKGNDTVREAHQLIIAGAARPNYIGNVEGRDVFNGSVDVVICEGFLGNVVLKVSEGMASMMMRTLADTVTSALQDERHLAISAFQQAGKTFEYNEVGGAPLLGIDGICMISHGSSDARSIRNALKTAVTLKDRGVNQKITQALGASAEAVAP